MDAEKRDVTARGFSKGDRIRLTRDIKFQTHRETRTLPEGTVGVITSVGEVTVFAEFQGHDMEMLPGEWEVIQ